MDEFEGLSDFDIGQIVMARQLGQNITRIASLVGCSRSAVIKVITQKDDQEEGSGTFTCEKCGHSDRKDQQKVCKQCDLGYHIDCLIPPLSSVPQGDWTCTECLLGPRTTDDSIVLVEEVITDGKVTDVIVEVKETASTSSRRRPSNNKRPSRSSSRLRNHTVPDTSRGDPGPDPLPYPDPQPVQPETRPDQSEPRLKTSADEGL